MFPNAHAQQSVLPTAHHNWAQWRGPLATGVAPHGDPPVEWSETHNIRWKTSLPGKGHSSPIVWEDRIFLTAAIPFGDEVSVEHDHVDGEHDNLPVTRAHRFVVLAINGKNGAILWQHTAREATPREGGHTTGSLASASPVTDGKHLIASFGSRGLFGFTLDGELLWEKDFGAMRTKHAHGEGSSPALHDNTLIVNWDHDGDSFVTALDISTGKQIWKVTRDEGTSWSTPLVVRHNGQHQVVISATKRIRSYDLKTGDVIWECAGLSDNVVASPVAADGMLYAGSSYEFQAMLGIKLEGAKGDITNTDNVTWKINRHTPYVPSPLLVDGRLYFIRHLQGLLSCMEARTGRPIFGPLRLPGMRMVFASPVAAKGRIYITDRNGTTLVLSQASEPETLARNRLDDSFSASPAIVGRTIFLRGVHSLYCIAETGDDLKPASPRPPQ